jgi:hypothetical protein
MFQNVPNDSFSTKDWLVYLALPLAGVILGHFWTRYRRRLVRLRWTYSNQPVAFTTPDFGWGKVDILYEGKPAGNIHITTVRLRNDSQVDLEGLEVQCQVTEGTMVLRSSAQVIGGLDALPFAPAYAGILAESGKRKLTVAELAVWGRRSDFVIPTLNRSAAVDLTFLLARADHAAPAISLYCNHRGVRLLHEAPAKMFWGVNETKAALVGLLVGLAVVFTVVRYGAATWPGALFPWLIGASGVAVGASAIRLWRWVSRMAG